jgi:Restriction endonuclease S subunits
MSVNSYKSINDVVYKLIDYRGKTPSKTASGIKLITAKVIKSGFIIDVNHEYIAEDTYEKWMTRGLPNKYDVLITTEAPLGEVAMLKTDEKVALAQRVILLRGNPEIVDQHYLFYALQSDIVQGHLMSRATGTTVLGIKQSELRQVLIPMTSLSNQRKIASILSAYDDLIENNLRRIKILEEMAQRIYQEWFVHFRFPGHENVKMVESELGLIPEGWTMKTVGSISEKIVSGGTPTTTKPSYWDGPFPWLSSGETRDKFIISTDKSITEEGINNSSTRLAKRFDIVVASAGQGKTRGQASLLMLDSYINQSLISISVKEYCTLYVLFNISSRYEELRNISDASSIRGSLTTQIFNNLPILLPDTLILRQFKDTVMSNILLIESIRKQNKNLRQSRDLLLPHLISGELDVENLDIVIPEASA